MPQYKRVIEYFKKGLPVSRGILDDLTPRGLYNPTINTREKGIAKLNSFVLDMTDAIHTLFNTIRTQVAESVSIQRYSELLSQTLLKKYSALINRINEIKYLGDVNTFSVLTTTEDHRVPYPRGAFSNRGSGILTLPVIQESFYPVSFGQVNETDFSIVASKNINWMKILLYPGCNAKLFAISGNNKIGLPILQFNNIVIFHGIMITDKLILTLSGQNTGIIDIISSNCSYSTDNATITFGPFVPSYNISHVGANVSSIGELSLSAKVIDNTGIYSYPLLNGSLLPLNNTSPTITKTIKNPQWQKGRQCKAIITTTTDGLASPDITVVSSINKANFRILNDNNITDWGEINRSPSETVNLTDLQFGQFIDSHTHLYTFYAKTMSGRNLVVPQIKLLSAELFIYVNEVLQYSYTATGDSNVSIPIQSNNAKIDILVSKVNKTRTSGYNINVGQEGKNKGIFSAMSGIVQTVDKLTYMSSKFRDNSYIGVEIESGLIYLYSSIDIYPINVSYIDRTSKINSIELAVTISADNKKLSPVIAGVHIFGK